MKIEITAPYVWFPVQKMEEEIRLHIYVEKEKIREFDICLGDPRCDFYAYIDVSPYIGKTLEIKADVREEKLNTIFCYKEKPQNVYPFRPQLHFTPQFGWNNDPNGLVYDNGVYHLYYQWNPFGLEWGNIEWGHAVSEDLIHWEYKEEALVPDETGHMYSGCALLDKNNILGYGVDSLLFYYTAAGGMNEWSKKAGNVFTQRLAYSNDHGETLQTSDKFIIQNIKRENRDPHVFYHEQSKAYIMVLYLEEYEFGIYRSTDLLNWEETQRLTFEDMWECPALLQLEVVNEPGVKKWVFWSADGYYVVGAFDGYEFEAQFDMKKAYVGTLPYAAQTYANVSNRVVSVPWMRMLNDWGNYRGMMGIPQELTLKREKDTYKMRMQPVRELENIKQEKMEIIKEESDAGCLENQDKQSNLETACVSNCLDDENATDKMKQFSFEFHEKAAKLSLVWEQNSEKRACIYLKNIIIYIDFKKELISLEQMSKNISETIGIFDHTKPFSLDLIIDQEIIEFYGADGTLYGALETDENILGYKLICESEAKLLHASYIRYI